MTIPMKTRRVPVHMLVLVLRTEDVIAYQSECVRAKGWETRKALATLIASMTKNGQDSPIIVRPDWNLRDDVGSDWLHSQNNQQQPYRVVTGFRRHAALRHMRAKWIRCQVLNLTDTEARQLYYRESDGRRPI